MNRREVLVAIAVETLQPGWSAIAGDDTPAAPPEAFGELDDTSPADFPLPIYPFLKHPGDAPDQQHINVQAPGTCCVDPVSRAVRKPKRRR
jgi:hypothetical protein